MYSIQADEKEFLQLNYLVAKFFYENKDTSDADIAWRLMDCIHKAKNEKVAPATNEDDQFGNY